MAVQEADLQKVLIERGVLDAKKFQSISAHAKKKKISLEDALYDRDVLSEKELAQTLADLYEVPFVRVSDQTISEKLLPIVPHALASHQYLMPFKQEGKVLHLALNDPHNFEIINFLENKTGLEVKPYYATKKDIKVSLKAYNKDVNQKFTKLLEGAMKDPNKIESLKDASKIVDTIILFAYQNDASDIHLEPHKQALVVRYRIDGILGTIAELPIEIADLVSTRIKVLANLRTDEHRAAQDGRFKIELENNEITLRISIIPTYDGEKVVMRLLSSTRQELNLATLGYSKGNLEKIEKNIKKTHGIVLMTGPTGSGKTTALYALLKKLNSPEVNISTIEDPIEYRLGGVNQTQVNKKTELTFANGLRALLRQDPDIILVGEIRDVETASVAINAALTGHLVLATLHTNDAATTLPRMLEMDVESFLLAATAQMVIAQRLVRTVCEKCKKSYKVSVGQLEDLGKKFQLKEDLKTIFAELGDSKNDSFTFYKGEGCETCNGSGYKGRTSIAEVMEISDPLRKSILENTPPKQLEEIAVQEGMHTMFIDGMKKVLTGKTTIEEVLRVMRS
jgi:type IV pilus assembly protein PilB